MLFVPSALAGQGSQTQIVPLCRRASVRSNQEQRSDPCCPVSFRIAASIAGMGLRRLSTRRERQQRVPKCRQNSVIQAEVEANTRVRPHSSSGKSGAKKRVAVVLNRHAKGVTSKVEQQLEQIVGPEHCFICTSHEDAVLAAQVLLARNCYALVACGGGDGTLHSVLHCLQSKAIALCCSNHNSHVEHQFTHGCCHNAAGSPVIQDISIPPVAVLRLGTGNGIAGFLGARRSAAEDLQLLVRLAAQGEHIPSLGVQSLEISWETENGTSEDVVAGRKPNSVKCFFGGLGYDARWLQDFKTLGEQTLGTPLSRLTHSVFGYVLALLVRTIPSTLRGEHVFHARVVSLGSEAYFVDPTRGDWLMPRAQGEVLYEGSAGIVSFSTVPYYGGGVRLFPFAGLSRGLLQIRISNINPLVGALRMHSIWKGDYRNPNHVFDFLVRYAVIELEQPTSLQHSGDLVGKVRRVRVSVAEDDTVQLVDFNDMTRDAAEAAHRSD